MGWEAWFIVGLICLMVFALLRHLAGPDTILLGGLAVVMIMGHFFDKFPSAHAALSGFGSVALITIAVLFVVAEALTQTGAMTLISRPLLGRPKNILSAQVRMMLPVTAMSAFLNNTPIVAMFIPVISDWSRRAGLNASKLLIPLSYASIMGGACTLIGTASNIYIADLVREQPQLEHLELGMFTLSAVGIPAAIVGIIYILIFSRKILPERQTVAADVADTRRYTVEMMVEPNSPIDGATIEAAGLRHLPGVYLMEVERGGTRLVAVGPELVLQATDRLIFVGVVESVADLQKIRGLIPATDQVFKVTDPRADRCLVEAVVSPASHLVGKTVRESRFRTHYNAAIIAVHRGGQHIAKKKIGDIVLQIGDTLLLEAHPRFVTYHRNSSDFLLVSSVEGSQTVRHNRAPLALLCMIAMIVLATFTPVKLVTAALLAAGVMIVGKCCSSEDARRSIQWRVLLTIGAATGIGKALDTTGAASAIGHFLVESLQFAGPVGVLCGVYLMAMLFNSMIGPIGSAALCFPIALSAAGPAPAGLGVDNFMPFAICLMMAASSSFATPLAYQTNLMVYAVGGYRFSDYLKLGLPLNFIIMAISVTIAPIIWPFFNS